MQAFMMQQLDAIHASSSKHHPHHSKNSVQPFISSCSPNQTAIDPVQSFTSSYMLIILDKSIRLPQTLSSHSSPVASLSPNPITHTTTDPVQPLITGCISNSTNPSTQTAADPQSSASRSVPKRNLKPVDVVLALNTHLGGESRMGKLACKLARDCVFGEDVMDHCSVYGCRGYEALSPEGILLIKDLIIQH